MRAIWFSTCHQKVCMSWIYCTCMNLCKYASVCIFYCVYMDVHTSHTLMWVHIILHMHNIEYVHYLCMCTCMWYACTCLLLYVCMHVFIHTCIYVCICRCACLQLCVSVYKVLIDVEPHHTLDCLPIPQERRFCILVTRAMISLLPAIEHVSTCRYIYEFSIVYVHECMYVYAGL